MTEKTATTTQTAKTIGAMGEMLACDLLEKRGFVIKARNFSCRFGEIDIVALHDGKIHFIEVRLRSNLTFGTPEETVNFKKLQRLRKAIECYWQLHAYIPWQLDIIAICTTRATKSTCDADTALIPQKITWYKNIPLA